MLPEVVEYYKQQRIEQSLSTSILFALEFDPTATFVASGTTTGLLSIHSLSLAAFHTPHTTREESIVKQCDLSSHGGINALCTCRDQLFIATDSGIMSLSWDSISSHSQPREPQPQDLQSIVKGTQVNDISLSSDGAFVLAACKNGTIVRVDCSSGTWTSEALDLPGTCPEGINFTSASASKDHVHTSNVFPHSIAASPADRHCFITGCNDGFVRQYDLRRSKGLVRTVSLSAKLASSSVSTSSRRTQQIRPGENSMNRQQSVLASGTSENPSVYVPTVAFHPDGMYAMVGTSERKLSSLHIASASVTSTAHLPFVPQAIATSGPTFYVGGSDRRVGYASSIPNHLFACDVLCEKLPSAPVSAGAVYAVATHRERQFMAAAGFTPAGSPNRTQRLIDIYLDPPIRSFCVSI